MKPPRDPNRIDPLLALLREVWMECPDLRLSQILVCAIRSPISCPQIFYAEDDVVERGLREMIAQSYFTVESKDQHGS